MRKQKDKLAVYRSIPGIKTLDDVVEYFFSTLLPTNRRWSFYVDWKKVRNFVEGYKVELGILGAVVDSNEDEFRKTLLKYPEIVKVFPRLLAIREDNFSILIDPEKQEYFDFNFKELPKNKDQANKYIKFWKESGLSSALRDVENLKDYYYGVEVGSDTNARKNRGGTEWESLIEPIITDIAKSEGYDVIVRKKFEKVLKELGFKVPAELERNMDFLVYKKNSNNFIDIEANFFSGPGTKLEVPGAYVNRKFSEGFTLSLFLFTDGMGWHTAKGRVKEYFEKFPCVMNYKMAKSGVLKDALARYLR